MAEESIDPLVTPKKNELVPHYLRASTGSCHDFCKYGRKHAFEEKARKPLRKRIAKPSLNELTPVEIIVAGEPKREKLVRHKASTAIKEHSLYQKPSSDIKSYSPKPKTSLDAKSYSLRQNASSGNMTRLLKCKPSPIKKSLSPDPPEIIKHEILLPSKKVEIRLQQGSSTNNKMSRTEKKTDYQFEKWSSFVKSKLVKVKTSRNSDVKTSRNITASKASAKKALAPLPPPLSPRLYLSKRASTKTRKAGNFKKMVSPLKDRNRIRKVETMTSYNKNVPMKTLHVIKTGMENNSLESISTDGVVPSLTSTTPPKSLSRAKSPSLFFHEKDDEKTDYSGIGTDEFVSTDNESMENGKEESVTENHNTLIKRRVLVSEDKNFSPVKLKLRIGKAMDLQTNHNNPRRLKFRKGRVLGVENGKADSRKRTFKKDGGNDDATDAEVSSEKVVLKHQDIQGKRDAQGLFNNVIEETANKLVESRKSKVKALVGAFETVISLQESKPSSHNVS